MPSNQRIILIGKDPDSDKYYEVAVTPEGNLVIGGVSINVGDIALSGDVTVTSSALPTGAATEAKQDTGNNSLASIDGHVDGLESEIGATNEAAPSNDTNASGLNGRLQRIAQRLTTLIGFFTGSSLGALAVEIKNQLSYTIDSVSNVILKGTRVAATTMQNAVSATANGTSLDVDGYASAILEVTGTFSATVTFEGSEDDSVWYSLNAHKIGTDTIAATATTTGLYRVNCAGLKSIRARVTWTSGTSITVKGYAYSQPATPFSLNTVISANATKVISTAYESSKQIKPTAGTLYGFTVHNKGSSTLYVALYDAVSKTGTPVNYWPVYSHDDLAVNFGDNGLPMATGIFLQALTDDADPGTSDTSNSCWFTGRYS